MSSRSDHEGREPHVEPPSQSEEYAIARRLALTGIKVVGLLPTSAPGEAASRLPMELGAALSHFVPGQIGIVGDWRTWDGRAGGAVVADAEQPRLARVVPPPCSTAGMATAALAEALATHSSDFTRVLVDLARYAGPARLPDAADLVEGLVLVVRARRTRGRRLVRLASSVSPQRLLGAILLD
jgi:hypothetical protein